MQEWPILVFTALLTSAVGLAGYTALAGYWLHDALQERQRFQVLRLPMLVASGLAVAGLAASFAHLGYPMNAPNAIRHVASSWLSREILLVSAFIGAICLTTLWALRSGKAQSRLLSGAFLIGVLGVLAMGEIYRNTSVVTWMHLNTHVMFLGGLILMGSVLGLLLIAPGVAGRVDPATTRKLFAATAALVLAGLAAQLLVQPSYVAAIGASPLNEVVTYPLHPVEAFEANGGLRAARWVLGLAGAALMMLAAWQVSRNGERGRWPLAAVAGLLLLSGEVVGRYVFYAIHG
ncbi:dimethyl sulfoxide reductase anchor subunit family protein [Azospirillum ramasamyi]|uniref:Dimethyl sulfoxide reductase n=1 Tax=Azospirillum ramasamyi TaxID=682998 RepID=A0A2U9SBB9_9PROT|nr:DmsC/YnfH family molybdoenzyme membrane anchor subunit [Azospirillum ramasamyi]AWU96835.1 hypothetical protein DM194_21370 [Azospirillum ramasamyi]